MTNTKATTGSTDAGFSLVELLIAMTVTLIITGAVYGLLAGGQNAFRREPELTDRQQNIRVANDLILKDIGAAGTAMSPFMQVFQNGLDGVGTLDGAISGAKTDALEFLANDGSCPEAAVLSAIPAGAPTQIVSGALISPCMTNPTFMFINFSDGTTQWGYAFNVDPPDPNIDFPASQNTASGATITSLDPPGAVVPTLYGRLQRVRYEVANAPGENFPSLWRSEFGGRDLAGASQAAPAATGQWQLVARGIEDLQVEYFVNGAWVATPGNYPAAPAPVPATAIVQQVRVRLSSRAEGRNLQGQTNSASAVAGPAVRGQLVTVGVPRAALLAMTTATAGSWQ